MSRPGTQSERPNWWRKPGWDDVNLHTLRRRREHGHRLIKVKQIPKKRLFLLVSRVVPLLSALVLALVVLPSRSPRLLSFARSNFGTRALYDFVKLTSVQPYATALGAVIDFDPLAFGHAKFDCTNWTIHIGPDLYNISSRYSPRLFGPVWPVTDFVRLFSKLALLRHRYGM